MAAGEYLSMTAQRELMERELEVERRSLRRSPEGEAAELRGDVRADGGSTPPWPPRWSTRSCRIPTSPSRPTPARSWGSPPQNLGSPWQAAAGVVRHLRHRCVHPAGAVALHLRAPRPSSSPSCWARWPSLAVGVVLARFTERPAVVSALRQLAVTAIAAGGDLRGRPGDRNRRQPDGGPSGRAGAGRAGRTGRRGRRVKPSERYSATAASLVASV